MEGLLFFDRDYGRVGPGGYLDHTLVWCVEFSGIRFHIHTKLTGERGKLSSQGGPIREISIMACDGSCRQLSSIPPSIWSQAEPLIIEAINIDNCLFPDATQKEIDFASLAGTYPGGT